MRGLVSAPSSTGNLDHHERFSPTRLAAALALAVTAFSASAQTEVTAVLAGHAALPASTTVEAPESAGPFFETAAELRTQPTVSAPRHWAALTASALWATPSTRASPAAACPSRVESVQGFSGIVSLGNSEFLVLTDNGFGSKLNSQDALLMVHHAKADWAKGEVTRIKTTFLHDPDRKVPFAIQNEATAERFLTGIDFDPESIQIVGDEWWIGDEFGPYALRVTPQGKVLGVIETVVGGNATAAPTTA